MKAFFEDLILFFVSLVRYRTTWVLIFILIILIYSCIATIGWIK